MTITMVVFKSSEHAEIMRNDRKDDGEVEELMRGAYYIETTWVPFLRNAICAASAGEHSGHKRTGVVMRVSQGGY